MKVKNNQRDLKSYFCHLAITATGLLSLCWSSLARADDTSVPHVFTKTLFNIPDSDFSMKMLYSVFGNIGSVLPGETGIFNVMFKQFNTILLALAIIVIMYTFILTIINTAQQGEFMGQKMKSIWLPIRTVAGLILIIPTSTGYSLIQAIMMWLVIQGIGAADSVWNVAINYLFDPSTKNAIVPLKPDLHDYIALTKNMLRGAMCMYDGYQTNSLATDFSQAPPLPYPRYGTNEYNFNCTYNANEPAPRLPHCPSQDFGTGNTVSVNCGSIRLLSSSDPSSSSLYSSLQSSIDDIVKEDFDAAKLVYINSSTDPFPNNDNPLVKQANILSEDVQSYQISKVASIAQEQSGQSQIWERAKQVGWAQAGSFYYQIAKKNNEVNSLTAITNYASFRPPTDAQSNAYWNGHNIKHGSLTNMLDNLDPTTSNDPAIHNSLKDQSLGDIGTMSTEGSLGNIPGVQQISMVLNTLIYSATYWFVSLLCGTVPADMLGGAAPMKVNPLIMIQIVGNRLTATASTFYILGVTFALVGSWLTGMFPSSVIGLSSAFSKISQYILSPLISACMFLFMLGISMQIYIPLIPYIIFLFGVIGWLMAVIETILAAPLVALGICYPEGSHELLGKADPAVMLVTNVFIRPTFMIFGLISGLILSYVAVEVLNFSFLSVIGSPNLSGVGHEAFKNTMQDIFYREQSIGPIQLIFYISIYVSLVILILNKCFTLITIIPDKVLNWIGGSHQFGEYTGGEEAMKQKFGAIAGEVGKGQRKIGEGAQGVMSGARAGAASKAKEKQEMLDQAKKGGAKFNQPQAGPAPKPSGPGPGSGQGSGSGSGSGTKSSEPIKKQEEAKPAEAKPAEAKPAEGGGAPPQQNMEEAANDRSSVAEGREDI